MSACRSLSRILMHAVAVHTAPRRLTSAASQGYLTTAQKRQDKHDPTPPSFSRILFLKSASTWL